MYFKGKIVILKYIIFYIIIEGDLKRCNIACNNIFIINDKTEVNDTSLQQNNYSTLSFAFINVGQQACVSLFLGQREDRQNTYLISL